MRGHSEMIVRTHSSIGRVAVFEAVGCRFEPYWVHQEYYEICPGDEIGIHVRLRCVCRKVWGFKSPLGHHMNFFPILSLEYGFFIDQGLESECSAFSIHQNPTASRISPASKWRERSRPAEWGVTAEHSERTSRCVHTDRVHYLSLFSLFDRVRWWSKFFLILHHDDVRHMYRWYSPVSLEVKFPLRARGVPRWCRIHRYRGDLMGVTTSHPTYLCLVWEGGGFFHLW